MKLTQIISINGVMAIALGIALAVYAPLVMAAFGIADTPSEDIILYWNVASFMRLFGATMFGYGILLWSLRSLISNPYVSASTLRGVLFGLLLTNGLGLFVAISQQFAVWQSTAGWLLVAIYAVFVLLYAYFLLTMTRSSGSTGDD